MKTSPAGRKLIEGYEGLRLHAYQDSVGVWTIGYGDTGPDVVPGLAISRQEADDRLSNRLAIEFEPAVIRAIGGARTSQNQFDAMVSLAYNIGGRGFAQSSVARHHAAGDYAAAADAFLLWNKGGRPLRVIAGLSRRRAKERELYLSGSAVDAAPAGDLRLAIERIKDIQRELAAVLEILVSQTKGGRT